MHGFRYRRALTQPIYAIFEPTQCCGAVRGVHVAHPVGAVIAIIRLRAVGPHDVVKAVRGALVGIFREGRGALQHLAQLAVRLVLVIEPGLIRVADPGSFPTGRVAIRHLARGGGGDFGDAIKRVMLTVVPVLSLSCVRRPPAS